MKDTGLPTKKPAAPVPGSSADQPWLQTPMPPVPAPAPACDWAEDYPHESDGPYPAPSDWKQ